MLLPFVTWETFIGDNERKQWDASLFLSSPPQHSFISPSHKADSLLPTPCSCRVENRLQSVWDENPWPVAGWSCCSASSCSDSLQSTCWAHTCICPESKNSWLESVNQHWFYMLKVWSAADLNNGLGRQVISCVLYKSLLCGIIWADCIVIMINQQSPQSLLK